MHKFSHNVDVLMNRVLFIIPFLTFLLSCSKGNLDSFDFSGKEFELESLAIPKSFDFVVDEKTYRMNSSISQEMESIVSLETNKLYSTQKADNNCFYEYKIDTIENKMGVYTNYSNSFYSASFLNANPIELYDFKNGKIATSTGFSIRSSIDFNSIFIKNLAKQLSLKSLYRKVEKGVSIGIGNSQALSYLYGSSLSYYEPQVRTLSSLSTLYCPDDLSMSIGCIGHWLEINGTYSEMKAVFGKNKTVESGNFVISVAKYTDFLEGFIYSNPFNPGWRGFLGPVE